VGWITELWGPGTVGEVCTRDVIEIFHLNKEIIKSGDNHNKKIIIIKKKHPTKSIVI
jgi:hypothetical protein